MKLVASGGTGLCVNSRPNPKESNWQWGQNILNVVRGRMAEAGVLKEGITLYKTVGFPREFKEEDTDTLTCFEDFYLSGRNGVWMQMPFNHIRFRQDAAYITGEPADSITNPESVEAILPSGAKQAYCPPSGSKLSSARIKIFQRTATKMLRRFVNLDEVIRLAQTYTTVPIEVVTVNETSTMIEQIRLFNSFDILITSHGSHLANGVFTMNPSTKAVIEVVSFAFDRVFYGNYNGYLGFAEYLLSTGHLTGELSTTGKPCPFPNFESFPMNNCTTLKHAYLLTKKVEQEFFVCPQKLQTRACDNIISIPILQANLDHLFQKSLCRNP